MQAAGKNLVIHIGIYAHIIHIQSWYAGLPETYNREIVMGVDIIDRINHSSSLVLGIQKDSEAAQAY